MDYLVNLSLVDPGPVLAERMEKTGVTIRRALAPELELVTEWVRRKFQSWWSSETAITMSRQPPTCFWRPGDEKLLGFSCNEAIVRGFLGPTGVDEAARGEGIGHALLLASLLDLKTMDYGYAIIGAVGPSAFYERTVGAMPIPNSELGVHRGLLKRGN